MNPLSPASSPALGRNATVSPSRRRLLQGLCGAGCLLPGAGARAATPGVDEPPEPGPARPLAVPALHEHRLANGLRLVVAPQPALPLVSLALRLQPGQHADPAGRTGLASLTAELRPKGALHQGRRLGAETLARLAESLGGSLASGADGQGSTVHTTVARPRLAAAAALLASVSRHPTLAEDELALLRAETADALRMSLSDPMALAGRVAGRLAWGDSVLGAGLTPASLQRVQRRDVLALHRLQAHPATSTLVLAGDVTPEAGLALAEQLLGGWRSADAPPQAAAPAAGRNRLPDTVLVHLPGAGQCAVLVLAPAVAAGSPERRVAQVAAAVLGGGYSARLNTEVRIRRGLSYGAHAGLSLQTPGGWLQAQTQTDHRHAAEVVGLMQQQIRTLADTPPGNAELAARVATLIGGFGRQLETTAGLAGLVLDRLARELPLADVAQVVDELRGISAPQVADFAARHWAGAALRTVVVGDLDAAGPALRARDPQALVLQAADLDLDTATLRRA